MSKHKGIYVTLSHTKKNFANMKTEGKGFSGRITPLFPTMMVQAPEDMGKDSAAPTNYHSTPIALDLEEAKTAQVKEIASLKKRVKQLEQRKNSRTLGLKRLRKVGSASRVESSNDTQERYDEEMLFDVQDVLQGEQVVAEKEVDEKEVIAADPVTAAGEVVTTTNTTTTVDELTLAQTLIEIKAAKPKVVTIATTITTTTRSKAKGDVVQELSEFKTTSSSSQASQLPQAKDKGKGKMAEEQEKLEKEGVVQEEASRAVIIEELDSIQAMIDDDEQLAARLKAEEQEQFSIEEKSRMLVEMIAESKKFFVAQRATEQRSKPPTKNQIRSRMCTYLKNIEVVKSSVTRTEGSSKRAEDELESDKSKKQKIDEHVEAEKDDQKETEMKRHIEIVKDDEVEIDVIPLATKPPVIIEYKIDKDGRIGYFKLIRADGSSKRVTAAQLQLLSDYYCWKDYADREEIKIDWRTRILTKINLIFKEKMESQSETTQTVSALKLPVLKTRDYDLWSMRMEQYLTHTDYALWEVIVNGDAPAIASASAGTKGPIPPKTAEQKLARKNELKAKSTLLPAIPDEHLLKFHGIKDAKTL
ncbi:hypothetical protein Tco_0691539 [Tanacetum coccineum]